MANPIRRADDLAFGQRRRRDSLFATRGEREGHAEEGRQRFPSR
jgi:hypothetical protein